MTDHPPPSDPGAPGIPPTWDLPLRAAVLELERHAASAGWDQPPKLYALVLTERLLADEPQLAELLQLPDGADLTGSLTPVEQEDPPEDLSLEQFLTELAWPEAVHGTAVVVERLVLPPSVELPDDEDEAQRLAESHPERQEVRMVAGAVRTGATYCALRLRAHDDAASVLEGPDLVPALLELLQTTLAPQPPGDTHPATQPE